MDKEKGRNARKMGKKKTSKGSKTKKENVRGTQRTYDENESKKYRKK